MLCMELSVHSSSDTNADARAQNLLMATLQEDFILEQWRERCDSVSRNTGGSPLESIPSALGCHEEPTSPRSSAEAATSVPVVRNTDTSPK